MEPRETGSSAPEPSSRTKTAFALAVAVVGLFFVYFAQHVFFIAVLSVIVAIVLDAVARLGMRFLRLPRTPAVIVGGVLFLAVVAGTIALIAVPLMSESSELAETAPKKIAEYRGKVDELREKYPILSEVIPAKEKSGGDEKGASTKETVKSAAFAAERFSEGIIDFVAMFFLALFLALDPERYTEGVASLLPGKPREERLELLYRIGDALRNYLVALGIYIVAMAALWSLGLWLIGIPFWLLFGVIGGLLEVVPYVGPLIGIVPPLFIAVGMGGAKVGLVCGLYLVLHVIEGYILVPLLMQKREHLPPPVTLISILAFGAVFGFWGILLAVPMGTVIYVWVTHELLGEEETEADESPDRDAAPSPASSGAVSVEHVPWTPGLSGGL